MEIKLTCYGGVGSVTGANFLLEIGDRKFLIDCGLEQETEASHEHNRRTFEYDPASIEALFITHAHIDHTGLIPRFVRDGFRGKIYSTPETFEIAKLLLEDAARINREKEEPLYKPQDVGPALALWETVNYHDKKDFPPPDRRAGNGFSIELFDAGHVLGSSMIKFFLPNGKTFLASGDLGNSPSPLLKDTEHVPDVDYLLIESVYGDRNHENKDERVDKLKRCLKETIERGGTLLIPIFSLDRTQAILYELDNLFESGELPSVPVFLDSPLAIKITDIYERVTKHYNKEVKDELARGDKIFSFDRLRETMQARDSRQIRETVGPKIILAGSGMSTGGRITGHETLYLPDPNNTILFVGYQSPGTPGGQIQEGLKRVEIDGQLVDVRARVERIDGFSAHADSDTLVNFVETNKDNLKKVFVAMGETGASTFLAQRIRDELGVEALVPEFDRTYTLD